MLKYVIFFGIVTICHSQTSKVGDYYGLVFAQISPGSAYFAFENKMNNKASSSDDALQYLTDYADVLGSRRWIIHSLKATDSTGRILTDCHDEHGNNLKYHNMVPNEDFRLELVPKWPSFYGTRSEADIWESNYNAYGSCIKPNTLDYFDLAMVLLDEHNVDTLLQNDGIVPGPDKTYQLNRIIGAIRGYTHKHPYILCAPAPRNDQQYLLEVQICYDKSLYFIDCLARPAFDVCEEGKSIIYPGWPGQP